MGSLLNHNRPPVFCPGCSHDRFLNTLDQALSEMGFSGNRIVIVTDIGCSGLLDTYFNTHAFHGLHGRALTYATGIKMAQPDLTVIVIMGDGGLGIGGAHLLSTCRRNIDLTLFVLNNYNYGMTGGQFSVTTPEDALTGSGFLNRLEKSMDVCDVAGAAGAGFVIRTSVYDQGLAKNIRQAIAFDGFALMDIHGACTGRYTRKNRLTPESIEAHLKKLPDISRHQTLNSRLEFGKAYRRAAEQLKKPSPPIRIEKVCDPPRKGRHEILMLGSAGQRIITAGEVLCLAAASAGCRATQKNDYPITVMRGHSISEVILSDTEIVFTGIEMPSIVIALANEGITRRKDIFPRLSPEVLIIKAGDINLPPCDATVHSIDFKADKLKSGDWALAALAFLARRNIVLNLEMLNNALKLRFTPSELEKVSKVLHDT